MLELVELIFDFRYSGSYVSSISNVRIGLVLYIDIVYWYDFNICTALSLQSRMYAVVYLRIRSVPAEQCIKLCKWVMSRVNLLRRNTP